MRVRESRQEARPFRIGRRKVLQRACLIAPENGNVPDMGEANDGVAFAATAAALCRKRAMARARRLHACVCRGEEMIQGGQPHPATGPRRPRGFPIVLLQCR